MNDRHTSNPSDDITKGEGVRLHQTRGRDNLVVTARDGNIVNSSVSQGRGADNATVIAAAVVYGDDSPFGIRNLNLNGGKNYDVLQFGLTSYHDATITNNHDGTYTFNAPSQNLRGIRFTQYEMVGFQQMAPDANTGFNVRLQDIEAATQRTPTVNLRDLLRNRS